MTAAEAMALAIAEGRKGWGRVSPNPLVGCVFLDRDDCFLASGYHERKTIRDHAELAALKQINDLSSLRDGTAFVTLEPCSHHSTNKEQPCAHLLANLPIKKVVYGLRDPNPKVSGKGIEHLVKAGIQVEEWPHPQELEILAEHFLVNMREHRPFVALKVATTADGFIAHKQGERLLLTGPEANTYTHYLRAGFDAILIGKTTFLKDDPQLNVRHSDFKNHPMRVVVLDRDGSGYSELQRSRLGAAHSAESIYWAVESPSFSVENPQVLHGDLHQILQQLFEKGIRSIFVEGGAEVYASFIKNGLVDRLYHISTKEKYLGPNGLHWLEYAPDRKLPFEKKWEEIRIMGSDSLSSSRVVSDKAQVLF